MTAEAAQDDPQPRPRQRADPPAYGPEDGLTPKQGRAVEALLREGTAAKAALAVGVNERTLRRWTKEPAFRAAVLAGRREAFGQAVGLTQRYAPVAVATLVKVMQDPMAAASSKVTAATALLRFGREGVEIDDLADRVERLEEAGRPRRSVASKTVDSAAAGEVPGIPEDDEDDDDPDHDTQRHDGDDGEGDAGAADDEEDDT